MIVSLNCELSSKNALLRKLCLFAIALTLALPVSGSDVQAQIVADVPDLLRLHQLAEVSDPQEQLQESDGLLAELDVYAPEDAQLIHDLLRVRLAAFSALNDNLQAGETALLLGQLIELYPDILLANAAPYFRQASQLFEAAGEQDAALEAEQMALEALLARNMDGAVILRSQDRIVALGGAPLGAEIEPLILPPQTGDGPAVGNDRGVQDGFKQVDVYYATDRARDNEEFPSEFYGYERAELEYGKLAVTIPNRHRPGAIENYSIFNLEFGPSPSKHIVLKSVTPMPVDAFFSDMQTELVNRNRKEAFVFVHGYNVAFEAAAKRAAQLAYDMEFFGVPILYSWPSRGSTTGYIADTAVVRLSGRRLSLFLEVLAARSGAERIHLIAHSMGNRAMTDALELLALRMDAKDLDTPPFDQIVFAAPDVDAGLFSAMIDTIRPLGRRLTLYASDQDWALAVSRRLHGRAPRAGQAGNFTVTHNALDSIDMSELGQDMLAHGYFGNDSSALIDLVSLFWQNLDPARRCGLERVEAASRETPVWRYRAGSCHDTTLLGVLSHLRKERLNKFPLVRDKTAELVEDQEQERDIETIFSRMFN